MKAMLYKFAFIKLSAPPIIKAIKDIIVIQNNRPLAMYFIII